MLHLDNSTSAGEGAATQPRDESRGNLSFEVEVREWKANKPSEPSRPAGGGARRGGVIGGGARCGGWRFGVVEGGGARRPPRIYRVRVVWETLTGLH